MLSAVVEFVSGSPDLVGTTDFVRLVVGGGVTVFEAVVVSLDETVAE